MLAFRYADETGVLDMDWLRLWQVWMGLHPLREHGLLSMRPSSCGADSLTEDQNCMLDVSKFIRGDFLQQCGFTMESSMCPLLNDRHLDSKLPNGKPNLGALRLR